MKDHYDSIEDFHEDYGREHRCCPNCGGVNIETTLMGYIANLLHPMDYKDGNVVKCLDCGFRGIQHDLVYEGSITDRVVEWETANALKTIGFSNHSKFAYVQEHRLIIVPNGLDGTNLAEAPTLNTAMEWLRRKHNAHIEVKAGVVGNGVQYKYTFTIILNKQKFVTMTDQNNEYETYEKAVNAAICHLIYNALC
jgi:hypothetical protein